MLSEILPFVSCVVGALFFFAVWEEIGTYFDSKKIINNLRLAWIVVLGSLFYFVMFR